MNTAALICSVCGSKLVFRAARGRYAHSEPERLWLKCESCGQDHILPRKLVQEAS